MKTECPQFAPLDVEEAEALQDIINGAVKDNKAVLVDPDEVGIIGSEEPDLISNQKNINALVRYQRHYHP